MRLLTFKDLEFVSDNTQILNGISFEVQKGDCISIVGPSGSGKSTLLKAIADLIPLSKGALTYQGKDYMTYEPEVLRQHISYCVQLPHLFGETVYDNLSFPFIIRKEPVNKRRMIELLTAFNLDAAYLDKSVHALSGGEKQRISLARSLMFLPDVLLLDEATSALDPENAENILNYIKHLSSEGITILWITHDVNQSTAIFNKRLTVVSGKVAQLEVL